MKNQNQLHHLYVPGKPLQLDYEVSLKVGTTKSMPIDDSPGVNLSM